MSICDNCLLGKDKAYKDICDECRPFIDDLNKMILAQREFLDNILEELPE